MSSPTYQVGTPFFKFLQSNYYILCICFVSDEELIKWGWPEDVWFHVDKLSSAHVYLRLKEGETLGKFLKVCKQKELCGDPQVGVLVHTNAWVYAVECVFQFQIA